MKDLPLIYVVHRRERISLEKRPRDLRLHMDTKPMRNGDHTSDSLKFGVESMRERQEDEDHKAREKYFLLCRVWRVIRERC